MILLCAALSLFFLFYPFRGKETISYGGGALKTGRTSFPHEAIGSGGLALHPRHALGWVSRLADELVLIAYNSRPDVDPKEAKILFSLKNGKEQLNVPNGRTIYLKESDQGRGLHSSDQATSLWVKPILLENGAILIEARRKLVSKEGVVGEEKGQFVVSQGGAPLRYHSAGHLFAKALKSARVFSQDLLIQKYGGREYETWRNKAVLEITETAPYACFVSAGDYMLYENGEWTVCPFEELKPDQPIAHVKSISASGVELEIWDETGFCPAQFKMEMEKQGRLQVKPEMMPSSIRLRSNNQVSCAFGKRRVILKQGDWLLKTPAGWRNLRRAEEIEQYLQHRLKGELFIFDAVEKEQGRSVVKGHLFDETRTQIQPLSLPIEVEKGQGKAVRKRKSISAINPRLKNATICAARQSQIEDGEAAVLKEEHHCQKARAAETRESPVDFRSAKQVNAVNRGRMKIDLAKPQPADCRVFEARVNNAERRVA